MLLAMVSQGDPYSQGNLDAFAAGQELQNSQEFSGMNSSSLAPHTAGMPLHDPDGSELGSDLKRRPSAASDQPPSAWAIGSERADTESVNSFEDGA